MNVHAYQDEDGKESPNKRPKLASARHTRPPKGINNLCSAGSKPGDIHQRQQTQNDLQGRPSLNDASITSGKKQTMYNYISAKKN